MTEDMGQHAGAPRELGVAVLGLGNVGTEVVRIITENAIDLRERIGAPLVIRGIAVRDLGRDRGVARELLTDDPASLIRRDDVDIVIELSLIHISEPTRLLSISYAVFCLKKKTKYKHT